MSHEKLLGAHPMSHYTNSRLTQCHIIQKARSPNVPRKTTRSPPNVTLYKKMSHPMSHYKQVWLCTTRNIVLITSNTLFTLCMNECMVCVACPCRNVCTEYSYTLLSWVCYSVWDVRIKAHDRSGIHRKRHTIGREAKIEKNASIIHSFWNARKWRVIIVVVDVNSWPIVTSNCKSNPLCKFLFAVKCSR